uniref:NACHT LRR and PYD domain-containing protein n=1 Tax=Oryzias melastigma TaxID=30732 RepID=A0A3B3BPN5_ORYME
MMIDLKLICFSNDLVNLIKLCLLAGTPAVITVPEHTFLSDFRLNCCSLSEVSCEVLGAVLKNNPSKWTELDLSYNDIQDSGFLHLRGFLESPDCRLQTLRLWGCSFCEVLGLVLKNNPSRLTELDLSGNNIQDSGFLHLRGFLKSPDCRLQTLRLDSTFQFCSDQYDDKVVLTLNGRHEADVLLCCLSRMECWKCVEHVLSIVMTSVSFY